MASWADSDGTLNTNAIKRPGKVIYYVIRKVNIEGAFRAHLCVVTWHAEHPSVFEYGTPLEIWGDDTTHIPEGPATFIPVHKISSLCSSSWSTQI